LRLLLQVTHLDLTPVHFVFSEDEHETCPAFIRPAHLAFQAASFVVHIGFYPAVAQFLCEKKSAGAGWFAERRHEDLRRMLRFLLFLLKQ